MNMLVNHITRFIRRRLVLGIVFVFSLTYCIYSFSKDLSFTDSYAVKKMETAASNVNRKLFAWNSNTTTENLHSDLLFCRNSVQGKYLITDDQGYVCKRAKILSSGCCDSNSSFTKRYSCNTCKDEGCCNIYEYCVSCCMHPKQRPLLEKNCCKTIRSPESVSLLDANLDKSKLKAKKISVLEWKKYGNFQILLLIIGLSCVATIYVSALLMKKYGEKDELNDNIISSKHCVTNSESFKHAVVVSNAPPCASIAKKILRKGGNAVDAMIAAMLCDGVAVPQSMGIGGGFFMLVYNKKFNNFSTVIAREKAPFAATVDMFKHNSTSSRRGGLSIAVPGEVKGYWSAYRRFGGGVPWKELFSPTIALCEKGIPIDGKLSKILAEYEYAIRIQEDFRNLFIDPYTNELLQEGNTYKNYKLAKTLRVIAEYGGNALYEGPLAKSLVNDIRQNHGIITESDLKNYSVTIEDALETLVLKDLSLFTTHLPSSGVVLAEILRILDGLVPAANELLNTQRITEAFKYGYGFRSQLGDPKYIPMKKTVDDVLSDDFIRKLRSSINDTRTWNDPTHYGSTYFEAKDKGTANLVVLSKEGDAVVATSTINLIFGSAIISRSTGIILNNEMDDFSSPNLINYFGVVPSSANFIAPGKRPLSSACPSIFIDQNGNIRLLIGAAGGTKITTAVAIVAIRTLVMNETLDSAIDNVLFHHQLLPMVWQYYPAMSTEIVRGMKKIGHNTSLISADSSASVTAVLKKENIIYGSCDCKRMGQVDGY